MAELAKLESLLRSELTELARLSAYWVQQAVQCAGSDQDQAADMARSRAVTYSHARRRLESLVKELDITLPT